MRRSQQVACVLSVVLLMALTGASASRLSVNLLYTIAKQDSPLQIAGFKLPGKPGGYPKILLHNTTDKEITFFYLIGLSGNPRGVGGQDPKTVTGVGQTSKWVQPEPVIAPKGAAELDATFLRPLTTAFNAISLRSNCLHVAVIVTEVQFSDGTAWHSDSRQNQAMWKDSLRPESTVSCDSSPDVAETLKQVASESYSGAPSTHLSSDTVQSYSVACPVRAIGRDLVAVCDW